MNQELLISTDHKQVVDITDDVQASVEPNARAVVVFVAHTTCAVTTADLDPGTDEDLLDAGVDLDGKWLVLHAGASDPRRRYPIKEYAAAARELVDDGWQIVPKVMEELLRDPTRKKSVASPKPSCP